MTGVVLSTCVFLPSCCNNYDVWLGNMLLLAMLLLAMLPLAMLPLAMLFWAMLFWAMLF